ncbi:MAG TPA: hypothetical protein VFD70_11805 [Anaerolineae bacterium]|nr:hypothetical protein [Anaerolineae bacterium]
MITVKATVVGNPDGSGGGVARVRCPEGTSVVGGGFNGAPKLRVFVNNKFGNGWRVVGWKYKPVAPPLTVYARCLRSETAKVSSFTVSQVSTSTDPFHVYVPCPRGSAAVGGGYEADNHLLHIDYSHARGSGWAAQARLGVINAKTLTVTVICLSDPLARVTRVVKTFTVPPSQITSDVAVCPIGASVTAEDSVHSICIGS